MVDVVSEVEHTVVWANTFRSFDSVLRPELLRVALKGLG